MLAPKADSAASLDMGFDLVHLDGFTIHGLPPGGQVFLIARRVGELGPLFSEQAIDARMQVRGDTVTVRRIWFTQLWFVLHYMFYTRRNRVATVVTEYVETTFTRADLVQTTREYINDLVRKLSRRRSRTMPSTHACVQSPARKSTSTRSASLTSWSTAPLSMTWGGTGTGSRCSPPSK